MGAPKSAMTPSPVYWLIVPSNRWTSAVISSKQRSMMPCTSSGSSFSASVVNPATSAKRTVTWRRSPSSAERDLRILSARCLGVYDASAGRYSVAGAAPALAGGGAATGACDCASPRRWPPEPQKAAPGRREVPQLGQLASSAVPQWSQKRFGGGLSAWQAEQRIA